MMHARSVALAGWVAAGFALSAPLAVAAPITFTFPMSQTPFTSTADGVTASFSAPNDPGGFFVEPSTFITISGSVVANSGIGSDAFVPLDVSFSAPANSIQFRFGLDAPGPGTLNLEAFKGGNPVGSTSAVGTVPPNDFLAQGSLSFGGARFDSVVLSDAVDPGFAIGTISVDTPPIPEPTGLAVLGIGFAGLLLGARLPGRRWQG